MAERAPSDELEVVEEDCSLATVRRVAALLDLAPGDFRTGDRLPRGWHFCLFAPALPQAALGPDGWLPPPDGIGLERPRLLHGGRRMEWHGDLAIGQRLRRTSRTLLAPPTEGRSGLLVRALRHHEIAEVDNGRALLLEEEQLVYRPAAPAGTSAADPLSAAAAAQPPAAQHVAEFRPDERLLFRYSALTFNAHRIHYDLPYARSVEGHPALVVNGGLTALFLLQHFRKASRAEPARLAARNRRPLYCGRPARLTAAAEGATWSLRAENEAGETAVEMEVEACSVP